MEREDDLSKHALSMYRTDMMFERQTPLSLPNQNSPFLLHRKLRLEMEIYLSFPRVAVPNFRTMLSISITQTLPLCSIGGVVLIQESVQHRFPRRLAICE
jgi:hypothetical protein